MEWVYPNPAVGEVHFQLPVDRNWNESVIRIYDMQGRQRAELTVKAARTDVALNMEPGMYTYRIFTADQVFAGKLMLANQD